MIRPEDLFYGERDRGKIDPERFAVWVGAVVFSLTCSALIVYGVAELFGVWPL